jgi:hypothetical protein
MSEQVLTQRELNRALLARQLLLDRSKLPLPRALEQVAGLQTQYAPSAYVRLWTSLERFELADLTRALERKRAIQGTLMRSTIHVVSPRDYWLFAAGVGPSRQEWWLKVNRKAVGDANVDVDEVAATLRSELAGRTWHRKELDALYSAHGGTIANGAWVDLVRVPPSGTWERRRADLFRLASEWIEPADVDEQRGIEHLLRRYLQGFGPARILHAADWAGVPTAKMRDAAERLRLRRFRDEDGKELLDLPRAPLPDPDTPAPVRFLPHFDACLLVHVRRTGLVPEQYRSRMFHTKNPFSVGAVLVDGRVAAAWSFREGRIVVEEYEPLPREVEEERERLETFHA